MSFTTGGDLRLAELNRERLAGDYKKIGRITIENEVEITRETLIEEAATIYGKMRARKFKMTDYEIADEFFAQMRKEHKQFADSYPIVLRYICQMQQFHRAAFDKYISYVQQHPWKTQEEFLDSQSQYVVLLYKQLHHKWNRTQTENLRKNIRKMLMDEHTRFKDLTEKYKGEVEFEEKGYRMSRAQELHAFYTKYGDEAVNIECRVESEINGDGAVDVDSIVGEIAESASMQLCADDLI